MKFIFFRDVKRTLLVFMLTSLVSDVDVYVDVCVGVGVDVDVDVTACVQCWPSVGVDVGVRCSGVDVSVSIGVDTRIARWLTKAENEAKTNRINQ